MNRFSYFLFFTCFALLWGFLLPAHAKTIRQTFVLRDTNHTRLCETKHILTVNGQFPGPTLTAAVGDTIIVTVVNRASENVTIHWHGVKQPRFPWSDGPSYITQCPIQPGTQFSQRILLSDEIGTLWWHAHSDWSRATVYGALIITPQPGSSYPFAKPDKEIPILLGEWWKSDIPTMVEEFIRTGGDPQQSDAYLINGQPGDLYPCSSPDTFKLKVDPGKRYLLRMINNVMNTIMFLRVANHSLTVVGSDGSYLKPFTSDYISISPGQTIDCLLVANQQPGHYYMASSAHFVAGNSSTLITTAIVEYTGNYTAPSSPVLPTLPAFNDTSAEISFLGRFRSLASSDHPVDVPTAANFTNLLFTLSVNTFPCPLDAPCAGAFDGRMRASLNNITYVTPSISILQAYYNRTSGVYGEDFPRTPLFAFNYTRTMNARDFLTPTNGTEAVVLEFNSTVELVLQGTSILGGTYHPMHLHGYSFYVVGKGPGNFDGDTDPSNYNLVDPPLQNTIAVPQNGWTAIRFKANNPGVWLLHCHLERHVSWGMEMPFIVRDGKGPGETMLPPPPDMPRC